MQPCMMAGRIDLALSQLQDLHCPCCNMCMVQLVVHDLNCSDLDCDNLSLVCISYGVAAQQVQTLGTLVHVLA